MHHSRLSAGYLVSDVIKRSNMESTGTHRLEYVIGHRRACDTEAENEASTVPRRLQYLPAQTDGR